MRSEFAPVSNFITNWITTGGIVLVFVLMAAESCGIPFPSEVIMPFAGFFAAQGHISLTGSIIAGTLGNVAGSLVAYGLAARFGRPLLLGPGRRIGIRAAHLDLADRWFERHGLTAVLVGRVLPVVRTYISFPAGLAHVEPVRFTLLTAIGALPWCIALAAAGIRDRRQLQSRLGADRGGGDRHRGDRRGHRGGMVRAGPAPHGVGPDALTADGDG